MLETGIIESKVLDILSKFTNRRIEMSQSLSTDLGLDSMSLINLVSILCDEFGIEMELIDERDFIKLSAVSDLTIFFNKYAKAQ